MILNVSLQYRYLFGLAIATGCAAAQTFERDVQPIFAAHCVACHGGATTAAGLDLRTAVSAIKGSASGAVLVKGASEKSLLYQRVSSGAMPPAAAGKPLSNEQIRAIQKWIDEGLQTSEKLVPPLAAAADSGPPPISEKDRQFWAFRKPIRPAAPNVKNRQRVRTPIDAFLLAKLEAKGLSFSADASQHALLRRAYIDLIGLPPSAEEVRTFLADSRPDAYERLIDRLLASPQYGERWGRHWLDAAGYNDEQGYASDLGIVIYNEGVWRYRDYVVRSFNQDKGYDRFLTEQLAGDELVDWRNAPKYTPEIIDSLTATGYLRTMQDLTDAGEANLPPYYYDVLTRVVDNFSSGVLGLTGGCARCHNHKYDPIPQKDYYSLLAVFASGYNPEAWKRPKERFLPTVSKAEQEEIERFNAEIDKPLGELKKELDKIRRPHEQRIFEAKLQAAVGEALRADVRTAFETPANKRTDIQKYLFTKMDSTLKVTPQEVDKALSEPERVAGAKLEAKINLMTGWRRSFDKIQALWDVAKPPTIHVLQRGVYESPGAQVKPGFFTVLSEIGKSEAVRPPETAGESSGMRLALAKWLTSRDHPLTARVMVNRIWMHHFGKGIVNNLENFGRGGTPPTHPELLDWLAVDFMENGWKMKRLHKMIMMSTAYRQSSRRAPDGGTSQAEVVDPSNDLLWRVNLRRVEAEVLRDSVLALSGKLDLTTGGKPLALEGSPDGLVTASEKDNGQFRRSLYLMARRNYSLTMLDVFDFPIMALNCTRRNSSATPLQSLTMLNSEFVMRRAEEFATRVIELAGPGASDERKVETAFLLALARKPTAEESQPLVERIINQRKRYLDLKTAQQESEKLAVASVSRILFGANEFLYVE